MKVPEKTARTLVAEKLRAPRRRSRAETRERLLDTAEALFADHGYDGTSTHEIARAAKVEQSLVSYYFGSKEQLYRSLIERRAEPFCRQKSVALDEALAAAGGKSASAEAILHAFIRPVLAHVGGPASPYHNYVRLLSQGAHLQRRPDLHRHFDDLYRPIVHRFVAELGRALPEVPREDIMWSLHFIHAALGSLTGTGNQIEIWGDRLPVTADLSVLERKLVELFAAGLRRGGHGA